MAKKPQPRTLDEIQAEYARVCMEIGDLCYRRDTGIPDALVELHARAKALNIEAEQAKKSNPGNKE